METLKKTGNAALDGFYNMTWSLPFIIAMSVCSAFSMTACLVTALICCFLKPFMGLKPSFAAFIVMYSSALIYGTGAALAGSVLSGIILVIFSFCDFEKVKNAVYAPCIAAIMMGFTLYMTIMQTTDYFGIGASGNTFINMIKSYKSLGFHTNWRGVLYGTIVLVLMIVYRRKLKNLSKKIPAAFWCFVFTIALNLFLIPDKETTPIGEIGNYSLMPQTLISSLSFDSGSIIGAIICCTALCFINIFNICPEESTAGKKIAVNGAANAVSSFLGGFPMIKGECGNQTLHGKFISAISGCICCVIILVPLHSLIERTPLPTAAVILIIAMWQTIDGKYFTKTFKSGAAGIIAFFAVIAVTLLISPETAVVISGFICAAYKLLKERKTA